jgi:hypothetical protein
VPSSKSSAWLGFVNPQSSVPRETQERRALTFSPQRSPRGASLEQPGAGSQRAGRIALFGWWWAHPTAALAMPPFVLQKGREAIEEARESETSLSDACPQRLRSRPCGPKVEDFLAKLPSGHSPGGGLPIRDAISLTAVPSRRYLGTWWVLGPESSWPRF